MSIFYKNIDLTITGDKASISPNLFFYIGDFGLDIYFTLKSKPYIYQKNTINLLNSYSDAYVDTTLVKPNGQEVTLKNAPVVEDDKLKMTITKDMTDDLDEVGTYKIQFHIGNSSDDNDTSMYSIPPFEFEVKERLRGDTGGGGTGGGSYEISFDESTGNLSISITEYNAETQNLTV